MNTELTSTRANAWSDERIARSVISEARAASLMAENPDLQKEFSSPKILFAYAKAVRNRLVLFTTGMPNRPESLGDAPSQRTENHGPQTLDVPREPAQYVGHKTM